MATVPRFFVPENYYHVYNCGVEKRTIYEASSEYIRFINTCRYYQYDQRLSFAVLEKLSEEAQRNYFETNPMGLNTLRVHILAYCLMPNHFHFVLKPYSETGLSQFVADISNSLTKYFNKRYCRVGALLQGPFKAKEIENESSLLQVTRYIHLNPVVSKKVNPSNVLLPEHYPYSSYQTWLELQTNPSGLAEEDVELINDFLVSVGGTSYYKSFVESKVEARSFSEVGVLCLEEDLD